MRRNHTSTSQKAPRYASISALSCCVTNVHLPGCSREGETIDAHLDGFLVHWLHSHRRATEHDATIQHPPHKFNLILAGATSRYRAQVEKDQESLQPFGWDIGPVMGTGVIIEEAFMDILCDLMYGGGWMEIEREEVDRECN